MAITQTNNVSGIITLASGGNNIGTVNIGSGINISGQSVNISGQAVQIQTVASTFIAGSVTVTGVSGGTQLPTSTPLVVGVLLSQTSDFSGGSQAGNLPVYVGGLNNNAPYIDTTVFPPYNGILLSSLSESQTNLATIPVNNTNQIRIVTTPANSGMALRYSAW